MTTRKQTLTRQYNWALCRVTAVSARTIFDRWNSLPPYLIKAMDEYEKARKALEDVLRAPLTRIDFIKMNSPVEGAK